MGNFLKVIVNTIATVKIDGTGGVNLNIGKLFAWSVSCEPLLY